MIILPDPPTVEEKYKYTEARKMPFYLAGVCSFILLSMGMWMFTLSHPYFYFYGIFAFIVTFYLSLSYLVGIFSKDFDLRMHNKLRDFFWNTSATRPIPSIDIYLPCCGEDIEVIENTYKAVCKLQWSYSALNVYVLDDGWSDEVMALAGRYKFHYIRRDDKGVMKKAGNLRHAFTKTDGDLIVIFDADFAPRPDFLIETVPYFSFQKTAIVQTPQYFTLHEDQTWVEKGAGYIQELFYRMIQVNRNHFNGSICVGSCAVYRRTALEPFGGTANIGYSEDVHTGFNCVRSGWQIRYLPINLAKGVCPNTLPSFFMQQYRWATGSLTLFTNPEFWKSTLTVWQKMCYLSGMLYYATTGLALFLSPLPAILLVWLAPQYVLIHNAVYSVPSFLFGLVFMAVWTQARFGWYVPRIRIVAYFAHLFALIDRLRGELIPWQATGAVKKSKRFEDFRNLIFTWTSLSTIGIVLGIGLRIQEFGFINFVPMLFFTLFNFWLSMSILRDQ